MKLIVIFFVSAFMTSCSRLQIVLDWSDTILISRIEDYFEFNSGQKKEVKSAYKAILKSVKKEEIQQFSNYLLKIKSQIENNKFKFENIVESTFEVQSYFKTISLKIEPQVQKIIESQSKKGFETFDSEFLKKYEEDKKKSTLVEKEKKKQLENWLNWTDRFLGTVTKEQNIMIQNFISENPKPRLLQIESRKQVFEKFKLVRNHPESRAQFITQFLTDWPSLQTDEYKEAQKKYLAKSHEFIYQLYLKLGEKQKAHLLNHISDIAEQMQILK